MQTLTKKHDIYFYTVNNGADLTISRNGRTELVIRSASPELREELSRILIEERDYEAYLEFFNIEGDVHLGTWLIDLLVQDKSVFIRNEFKRCLVVNV